MKKLCTLAAFLCCFVAAKAQQPRLDITNTTSTAINMVLFANGDSATSCMVSGNTHTFAVTATTSPYNVASGVLAIPTNWLTPTVPFPATNLTEMSLFVTVGGSVYSEHILFCGATGYTKPLTFSGMFFCMMSLSVVGTKYVISLY